MRSGNCADSDSSEMVVKCVCRAPAVVVCERSLTRRDRQVPAVSVYRSDTRGRRDRDSRCRCRQRRTGAAGGVAAVLVEVRLECEGASTARAFVLLGGRVSLDVCSQVGPVGERLAAVCAAERLLARVRALMTA